MFRQSVVVWVRRYLYLGCVTRSFMRTLRIHLIGVCGTGMGSLAVLLRQQGHQVSGSDHVFYPPMSEVLSRADIKTYQGFSANHLSGDLDYIVVGNVCRPDNPEARAAMASGVRCVSMPDMVQRLLLRGRRSLVVAGTHGKTTTSAMLAFLLEGAGHQPGYLIGGVPIGSASHVGVGVDGGPFVIEGDEYDSAFFEKRSKFFRYEPQGAIVTSVEHDHLDIFPTAVSYVQAFREFLHLIPSKGSLVAYAGDAQLRALLGEAPACDVQSYGLQSDDCGELTPVWSAAAGAITPRGQSFEVFLGGSYVGRGHLQLVGDLYLRNALAALALASLSTGTSPVQYLKILAQFRGVVRRQQCLSEPNASILVYDDFAHHPTAVAATLSALRRKHPGRRLLAVFEARSATACRTYHQQAYVHALARADRIFLAPLGRVKSDMPQLDTDMLARHLGAHAFAAPTLDALENEVRGSLACGDVVVVMSNGTCGGLVHRLVGAAPEAQAPHVLSVSHGS